MTRRLLGIIAAAVFFALVGFGLWLRADRSAPFPAFKGHAGQFSHFDPARPVPPLAFTDRDGAALALESFRGKVVLLNLWATWCAPCVREMPALDRLQAALGGPAFEVVALSIDRNGREAVEPFFARHGLAHLGMYLDPASAAARALGVSSLPVSILIGPDGRSLGRIDGAADWDSAAAEALVRFYLARNGPP